jgi:hypothetical protein
MRWLALIFFLPSLAWAGDPWDACDKGLGAAALAFSLADWRQTYLVAKYPDRWREKNNLLDDHPSKGHVNNYFAASLLLGTALAEILPSPARKGFLAGSLAVELRVVTRGYALGMRLGF